MSKNENNSHAFIRKMVENIKQTKDAQGPDDPKMNEVSVLQITIKRNPCPHTPPRGRHKKERWQVNVRGIDKF